MENLLQKMADAILTDVMSWQPEKQEEFGNIKSSYVWDVSHQYFPDATNKERNVIVDKVIKLME